MFERFTKDARRIVLASVHLAADTGAAKVGPSHLLLALADEAGAGATVLAEYGITAAQLRRALANPTGRNVLTADEVSALRAVGIDAEEVFRRLEEAFGADAFTEPATPPPSRRRGLLGSPFDAQAKKTLELSLREAIVLRHRYIGSEHILLALLRQGVPAPLSTVLTEHGVTYVDAKQRAIRVSKAA